MRPHRSRVTSIAIASAALTAQAVAAQEAAAPTPARVVRPDARMELMLAEQQKRIKADLDRQMQLLEMILSRVAEENGAEPDPGAPRPPRLIVNERTFISLAFGATTVESARASFARILERSLAEARRSMGLTPVQERKLRLAGEGDIKRYFDRVDEVRREFMLVSTDAKRMRPWLEEIRRLKHTSLLGPFGEGSIFSKVREKIRRDQEAAERQSR